ncbi:hypothetical protein CCYN49044_460015 [Capnocytophaga cynodegmi]|uniref:Uncharacterized protein n=1 Tax=Capnocytophaga cynodegmi TaxID=28189 RepID=A0A0B7HUT4_9FLAO|nr:hypothetical protein CCYN74_30143 [Capnocytophaga cynodegmi]CEN41233.1 hypothetical protein CCYN49044_460015 [Capnocytophaga cynodegmi]
MIFLFQIIPIYISDVLHIGIFLTIRIFAFSLQIATSKFYEQTYPNQ